MTQAFYSGISGLQTYSSGINIVSDNLANISTTGFRSYNAEFASLFENEMNTGASLSDSVGVGVQMQATSMSNAQGSFSLSDRSTDLAILGDGWFGIQGDQGDTLYTRDGSFGFNPDDALVTKDGFYVLGTMGDNISANDTLTKKLDEIKLGASTAQQKLRFPKTLTYPAEPTKNAKFMANIGVGKEGYEIVTTGAHVIDSQGNNNDLRLEFEKKPVQAPPGTQWSVKATTQSHDGSVVYATEYGEISFDESGALVSSTLTTIDNNGTQVNIDLGLGYSGIVSIDTPVVPGSSITDGTVGGDLMGYSINKNAEVVATFTNGMQSSVGKIAVYHFQNDQGLDRIDGTHFKVSDNSGKPMFFTDELGQNVIGAEVMNFALENSNVEMSVGLTELIIYQRAYDANSKSVTTADQMIQKALQMDA